jgi:hypothetical protein
MPRRQDDVDGFMAALDHPLEDGVQRLRAVISFRDLDDVAAKLPAVMDVVRRWVAAQLVTSRRAKCRNASAVKIAE